MKEIRMIWNPQTLRYDVFQGDEKQGDYKDVYEAVLTMEELREKVEDEEKEMDI